MITEKCCFLEGALYVSFQPNCKQFKDRNCVYSAWYLHHLAKYLVHRRHLKSISELDLSWPSSLNQLVAKYRLKSRSLDSHSSIFPISLYWCTWQVMITQLQLVLARQHVWRKEHLPHLLNERIFLLTYSINVPKWDNVHEPLLAKWEVAYRGKGLLLIYIVHYTVFIFNKWIIN